MKLFLISPTASCAEQVGQRIEQKFPDHHVALDERSSPVWIVAAQDQYTPARVSEKVGIGNGNGDSLGGLVVQIHDYYGFDSKSLWQLLEVWLSENN